MLNSPIPLPPPKMYELTLFMRLNGRRGGAEQGTWLYWKLFYLARSDTFLNSIRTDMRTQPDFKTKTMHAWLINRTNKVYICRLFLNYCPKGKAKLLVSLFYTEVSVASLWLVMRLWFSSDIFLIFLISLLFKKSVIYSVNFCELKFKLLLIKLTACNYSMHVGEDFYLPTTS